MVLVHLNGGVIGYTIKNNIKPNTCNPTCDILLNVTSITDTKNIKNKLFLNPLTLNFRWDWPNTCDDHIINVTDMQNNQNL